MKFTLQWYKIVLFERNFLRNMLNSGMVATLTTIICLLVASHAAYSIARMRLKGGNVLLGIFLLVTLFPAMALVGPLFIFLRKLDLINTIPGLVIPYTSFSLPFTVWVLNSYFKQIPLELEDAAKIDGCNPLSTLWRIILPVSAPGLAATGILTFIGAWNEFFYALVFSSTEASQTISVAIAMFRGVYEIPWGEIAAASIVATVPLSIVVLVAQKHIIEGLTAGAVKS